MKPPLLSPERSLLLQRLEKVPDCSPGNLNAQLPLNEQTICRNGLSAAKRHKRPEFLGYVKAASRQAESEPARLFLLTNFQRRALLLQERLYVKASAALKRALAPLVSLLRAT